MSETENEIGLSAFVQRMNAAGHAITKGTASKAASSGRIPCRRDERGRPLFLFSEASEAYLRSVTPKTIGSMVRDAMRQDAAPKSARSSVPADLMEAKAANERLKHARDLSEYAVEVGALIPAPDLARAVTEAVGVYRDAAKSSLDTLSADLAPMTDASLIARRVQRRDAEVLTRFADELKARLFPAESLDTAENVDESDDSVPQN